MSPDSCQTGEPSDNDPVERDTLPPTRQQRRAAERAKRKAERAAAWRERVNRPAWPPVRGFCSALVLPDDMAKFLETPTDA